MHSLGIASVIIRDFHRDTLTEIRLKTVHAAVQNSAKLIRIPLHCCRIGKVHKAHACLPVIRLPWSFAVGALYQIAMFCPFPEERIALGDVWVDPAADLKAFLVIPSQSPLNIRETILVPLQIAPMERFHPEAVKMKYT